MIGAPDLAGSGIDLDGCPDFLAGRLRRRLILKPADLQAHLARIDDGPDIDGRIRVTDLLCGNWACQGAVPALMGRCELVAMGLRALLCETRAACSI